MGVKTIEHNPHRDGRVAEWLRRLTRNPKVRTAVGSNPTLDSLVAVRNTSPGRPEPCEGNLVAVAGSCGGLMVKHPWPLLEISLSDFRGLATLNINTYLPTYHRRHIQRKRVQPEDNTIDREHQRNIVIKKIEENAVQRMFTFAKRLFDQGTNLCPAAIHNF